MSDKEYEIKICPYGANTSMTQGFEYIKANHPAWVIKKAYEATCKKYSISLEPLSLEYYEEIGRRSYMDENKASIYIEKACELFEFLNYHNLSSSKIERLYKTYMKDVKTYEESENQIEIIMNNLHYLLEENWSFIYLHIASICLTSLDWERLTPTYEELTIPHPPAYERYGSTWE